MNDNYLAHIIRDLFPVHSATICYGILDSLTEELRKPVHGIGAFLLHSENNVNSELDYKKYWEIGINGCHFTDQFCDLFISVDYDPVLNTSNYDYIAAQLKNLVKLNGFIFLINHGLWGSSLDKYFLLRDDLVKEAKKYSMLKNEKVYIYENIRLFDIL